MSSTLDLSSDWRPNKNGKHLPPCLVIQGWEDEVPSALVSAERLWSRRAVKGMGVPSDGVEPMVATVAAIWRLTKGERWRLIDGGWKDHVEAWLVRRVFSSTDEMTTGLRIQTRYLGLCRHFKFPGLAVVDEFAADLRKKGLLSFDITHPAQKSSAALQFTTCEAKSHQESPPTPSNDIEMLDTVGPDTNASPQRGQAVPRLSKGKARCVVDDDERREPVGPKRVLQESPDAKDGPAKKQRTRKIRVAVRRSAPLLPLDLS